MPQGLQVFHADGTIKLDTSTRISKVLMIFQIPSNTPSGTVTVPVPSGVYGTLFAIPQCTGTSGLPIASFVQISFSGNVMSWSVEANGRAQPGYIVIGVY